VIDASLADELAIRRVMERYMRFNDDQRLDAMLPLFTEDAIYRVGGVVYVGHEQIAEFFVAHGYRAGRPSWTDDDEQLWVMPRTAHVISSPVIDVDGDAATVESDFVVIDRDAAGHGRIMLTGRYRDRFRRQADGRWLIAERTGVSMARNTAPEGAQEPAARPR
jgi:3-phenylpropionate/cinnamic acid dioxygenase small subunit